MTMSRQSSSLAPSCSFSGETGLEMWARIQRERSSQAPTADFRTNHVSWLRELFPELFSDKQPTISGTEASENVGTESSLNYTSQYQLPCKCKQQSASSKGCNWSRSSCVVEIRGEPASGKTHWLMSAALRTLLPTSILSRFGSAHQFLAALRDAQPDAEFGAQVLLIDCDSRFSALRFFELLKSHADTLVAQLLQNRKASKLTADEPVEEAALVSECVDSCLRRIQIASVTNYAELHLVLHAAFDRLRTQSASVKSDPSSSSQVASQCISSSKNSSLKRKASQMGSAMPATQNLLVNLPRVLVVIDNVSALCASPDTRPSSSNVSNNVEITQRCVSAVRKLIQIYDALVIFSSRTCGVPLPVSREDGDDERELSSSEWIAYSAFSRIATHLIRIEAAFGSESVSKCGTATGFGLEVERSSGMHRSLSALDRKHIQLAETTLRRDCSALTSTSTIGSDLPHAERTHFRKASLLPVVCTCRSSNVVLNRCEFMLTESGVIFRAAL